MDGQSRRDFLRRTAAAGGAVAAAPLLGCSKDPGIPEGPPVEMAIARWAEEADPDPAPEAVKKMAVVLTEQAIANLGGMKRFVSRGDVVWIKPNMGFHIGPEFAANTNPDVVTTLVRLCLDAGAKQVKVGDNSCYGARKAYPLSGIEAAVKATDGEIVYLDEGRFKDVKIAGEHLDTWPLYPDIIESDLVINVPIAKHHPLTGVTACLKNYMGVAGGDRNPWHDHIATCLADLTAYMKPRLCVVDAVRVLTRHGPIGGDLKDVKLKRTVAAGTDPVALTALSAELVRLKPLRVKTIRTARDRGLGKIEYRELPLREVEVG